MITFLYLSHMRKIEEGFISCNYWESNGFVVWLKKVKKASSRLFSPRRSVDRTGTCGVSNRGSSPLEGTISEIASQRKPPRFARRPVCIEFSGQKRISRRAKRGEPFKLAISFLVRYSWISSNAFRRRRRRGAPREKIQNLRRSRDDKNCQRTC